MNRNRKSEHRDRFPIRATCTSCNHSCRENLIYLVASIALALDRLVRFINKFQVDLSVTGGEWNGVWTMDPTESTRHRVRLITYIINHNNTISFILVFFALHFSVTEREPKKSIAWQCYLLLENILPEQQFYCCEETV